MRLEGIAIAVVGGLLVGQLAASTPNESGVVAGSSGVAISATAISAIETSAAASAPVDSGAASTASATGASPEDASGDSSWLFPVEGADTGSLVGLFGDPRDGGNRSHAGLDILAPRGTPVLAPLPGTVVDTGQSPLGGNVVWLADASGRLRLFFAHLDTYEVAPGQRVVAGQRLGRVGNTGNAADSSPHLHFEVRRDGRPIDPSLVLGEP